MPSWQRFWWSILQFRAMLLPHDLDSSPKTWLDSCFTFSLSPPDVRSEHNEMAFRSNHWWNFGLYIRVCQGSILRVGIDVVFCIFVCGACITDECIIHNIYIYTVHIWRNIVLLYFLVTTFIILWKCI